MQRNTLKLRSHYILECVSLTSRLALQRNLDSIGKNLMEEIRQDMADLKKLVGEVQVSILW